MEDEERERETESEKILFSGELNMNVRINLCVKSILEAHGTLH